MVVVRISVSVAGSPSSSRGELPKSKPSMAWSRCSPASFAGPSLSASARASSTSAQQRTRWYPDARAWQIVEVARSTSTTIPTGAGVCSPGVKATWTCIDRTRLIAMSTVETRYCYRHPDRETGLSCSECDRPICADCANFGPVGVRCPDHASVRTRSPAARIKPPQVRRAPGIALSTGSAPVTYTLIALNAVIYLIGASQGGSLNQAGSSIYRQGSLYNHMVLYGPFVPHGGWYRLVTAMFLHESLLHIGFNMYALFVIGRVVEQYLGTARYIGLYFVWASPVPP